MTQRTTPEPTVQRLTSVERYYRWHARLYDATRWSFLFGRAALIRAIALHSRPPRHILEIGCGTGHNLVTLAHTFPAAHIVGLDLSAEMLAVARKKLGRLASHVSLLHGAYDSSLQMTPVFDVILFSYSLTMINPGWEEALVRASSDLADGGLIAVVDFHDSPVPLFKKWMRLNHVSIEGHLLPKLEVCYRRRLSELHRAYGGLWTYVQFIGEKPA